MVHYVDDESSSYDSDEPYRPYMPDPMVHPGYHLPNNYPVYEEIEQPVMRGTKTIVDPATGQMFE